MFNCMHACMHACCLVEIFGTRYINSSLHHYAITLHNVHSFYFFLFFYIHAVLSHAHGLLTLTKHPNSNIASTGVDYVPASGSLVFLEGETQKSFLLSTLQDSDPELDEYIFVQVSNAVLNTSSVNNVDTSVPPVVPSNNESLAFIIITENDDARGMIQFSAATMEVEEGDTGTILLQRTGGAFGEVCTYQHLLKCDMQWIYLADVIILSQCFILYVSIH